MALALFAIAVAFRRALKASAAQGDNEYEATKPFFAMVFGAEQPKAIVAEYGALAYNVMLLLYPFISPAVVAVYDCREVAGVWYLEADYTIGCYDSRWRMWAVLSGCIFVFYVAGLPSLAFFSIVRRKSSVAFLSDGYREDGGLLVHAWEVVEMLRKLMLTSSLIFWPKGSVVQITVAVLVSMFFLCFTCTTCLLRAALTISSKH